jgi:phenylpropionate dioxygenase-like ring-hydroxylating dioxygenase large terminal subunit
MLNARNKLGRVDVTPTPDWYLDNDEPRLASAWHPVARAADLALHVASPVLLLGRTFEVTRLGSGVVLCSSGWGAVERYGLVWVALAEPVAPLPSIPEIDEEGFGHDVLARRTRVSAGVLVDNFMDVTHFSYLHHLTFGRAAPVTVEGYELTTEGSRVVLRHDAVLHEMRRMPDGGLGQRRVASYTYAPPYWIHLQMFFPSDGERASATLVCQPESATSTVAYVVVALPAPAADLAEQVAFSVRVLEEDLRLLEHLEEPRLPLTLRTELHTRADRASVEMRRSLLSFVESCPPPVGDLTTAGSRP